MRTGWFRWFRIWAFGLALAAKGGSVLAQPRAEVSPSAVLFGNFAEPGSLPMVLSCTATTCAAFTFESAAGCRVRGVLLDAEGAPIEGRRHDFGRTGCSYLVTAAGDGYVLATNGAATASGWQLLQLGGDDLSVVRDLPSDALGRSTRGLYSDGKSVVALDWTTDDVAISIDLETGAEIGREGINDFWEPVVVPGSGQYLLYYPWRGYFARLSGATGHWLGDATYVTLKEPQNEEAHGYFRDGTFQLIWRAEYGKAALHGVRIDAATGKVFETNGAGEPAPRLLCEQCGERLEGAFQLGASTYVRFASLEGDQSLLAIDPLTGQRRDTSLVGPDITFPASLPVRQLQPLVEPRLAATDDVVYTVDTQHLSALQSGTPHYPGNTTAITPAQVRLASNGESYVAAWYDGSRLRTAFVSPKAGAGLQVERVLQQELDLPPLQTFDIASAGGSFVLLGVNLNDERAVSLVRRTVDASGNVGEAVIERTGIVLSNADEARVELGSDGERLLAALLVGPILGATPSTGSIEVQRRDANGAALEPLRELVRGATLLDGVYATSADLGGERQFAVAYRRGPVSGGLLEGQLRTLPAVSGDSGRTLPLGKARVLANDGQRLLLNDGALLDPRDGSRSQLGPPELTSEVSHWDGRAYVRLSRDGRSLSASAFEREHPSSASPESFISDEQLGYSTATGDGKGRSLIAYFATEAPEHLAQLRAVLLETVIGEGGAGGEGGVGGESGEGGAVQGGDGNGGAREGTAEAGAGGRPEGGAMPGQGEGGEGFPSSAGGDGATSTSRGPRTSSACGCYLPGNPASRHGALLALFVAAAITRRRLRAVRAA